MANSAQYSGLTADSYETLKKQLSGLGIKLDGTSGKVSEKGVSAQYNFDEANQTLTVSDVSVGFPASMMFSADKIIDKISEAVKQAGGNKVA